MKTTRNEQAAALALERLAALQHLGDIEIAHVEADHVLADLLVALGYPDVVAAWIAIDKWYA